MNSDNPSTILIIDNDEGVTRAVATRLEHSGYHCVTASTGLQGLAAFRDLEIDLVITDLNMPAGDGITLARAVREQSDVPIIIVTGFYDEFQTALGAIGNITVLRKPFDSETLVDLVDTDLALTRRAAS